MTSLIHEEFKKIKNKKDTKDFILKYAGRIFVREHLNNKFGEYTVEEMGPNYIIYYIKYCYTTGFEPLIVCDSELLELMKTCK